MTNGAMPATNPAHSCHGSTTGGSYTCGAKLAASSEAAAASAMSASDSGNAAHGAMA